MFKLFSAIFIICLILLGGSLFSNVPIYLANSDNNLIRSVSLKVIASNKFYSSYDYHGLDKINFLLNEYKLRKNNDQNEVANEYLRAACISIDNANKEEIMSVQSLSFVNALLENEKRIVLLWLHRGINVDELVINSKHDNKATTFYEEYEKIKKITKNNEVFNIVERYRSGVLSLDKYLDPCVRV